MSTAIALFDYKGATEQELTFNKGDNFKLINSDNSDWWYVSNAQDKEGYVPSTFVKLVQDSESSSIEEDYDSEEEEEESETESQETEQESEKETEQVDEDLDIEIKGVLSNLKRRKSRMTKATNLTKLLVPDQLEGFIDLPQGYRSSTLAKNYNSGIGRTRDHLVPELSSSGLAFRDLFLDKNQKVSKVYIQIKKRSTVCNIAFSMLEARSIFVPSGLKILGRHVRIALFDKTNIRSNIHHIPAILSAENPTVWRFSTKASLLFQKDDENTCFVRSKDIDIKLALLFEMCITVESPLNPNQTVELACGWGMFPLFTLDGSPLENKSYELKLHGGSPFEKGVYLPEPPTTPGILSAFATPQTAPRLSIRLWKLSKKTVARLNELPETFIANLSSSRVLAIYRQVLANSLLGHAKEAGVGPKFEPILTIMPRILEENDLLHLLVNIWRTKEKKLKSMEKVYINLRRHFLMTVCTIWPLFEICEFPKYIPGDVESLYARSKIWTMMQEVGTIEFLRKPQVTFKPFHTAEVEYDYMKLQASRAC